MRAGRDLKLPALPMVAERWLETLGRGCLFWLVVSVVLSVTLTVLINLGLLAL